MPRFIRSVDPAVAIAFACIILLLLFCSLYSQAFLSADYLLQQLKVASFLGVIATGMMLVILLGQIDLSVPWVVTAGAMVACAATAYGPVWTALAVPIGVLFGIFIGLVNGIGVAYLRIPSMIITLATNAVAQGLMVAYTGGFSPRDFATDAMRYLATGSLIPGVPSTVSAIASAPPIFPVSIRAAWCSSPLRSRGASALSAAYCSRAMRRRPRRQWAMPIFCRRSPPWCWAGHRSLAGAGPIWARWPV